MTEREIEILGFQKEFEYGSDNSDWYYYSYKIVDGLSFISCDNEQSKNGEWYVEVFNTEPTIRFAKMEQVQSLINIFQKAIVK
jgi:hypothetical protein